MRFPRPLRSLYRVFGFAVLAALGCDGPPPGPLGVVRQVVISLPSAELRPGRSMVATARPLDADGELVELPVLWRSLSPATLEVLPGGELRALSPGTGSVEATAGGVTARADVALVNPPAVIVRTATDTLRLTLPGTIEPLVATALDAEGELIIGAQFTWRVEATRIAQVDGTGSLVPVAVGVTSVVASLDGVESARPVRVSPAASATAPNVTEVLTTTLLPGVPFIVRGERFGATPGANTVLVDGLPALVTAASATELTAVLSASGVPCLPTRDVAVQVGTAAGIGAGNARLQVATQRALAVGEAVVLTNASASTCNEFADGAGRYLLAVQHAGRALGAGSIALTLDGRLGVGGAVNVINVESAPSSLMPPRTRATRAAIAHAKILEASAAAVHTARAANRSGASGAPLRSDAAVQVPPVNGIVQLRIPDLTSANLCNNFSTIGARTVYEGTHVAILEDTASQRAGAPTLAGTMDSYYVELGQEFDTQFWPLALRFGDPLVMDGRLDANNRVVLVATPRLNDMLNGEILGAVVTCDLYFRTQFASSNVGEVMYLQVPTSAALGLAPGTRERWRYEIRSTIAHELKHIVSFAGRVVRNQPLEEPWLEEATARHAEELYARARVGISPTGNSGYGAVDCEVRVLAGASECVGTPRTLLPHFEALWDFLDSPMQRSPLGPTATGDVSFYGSAWSLTRWALDHAGQGEDAVLQQLTASGQSGIANLEARVGRTWDEMLGRWALTLLAESRESATLDATLQLPSWNLANVFAGLCLTAGGCESVSPSPRFTRPAPLRPTIASGASFTAILAEIVPGGFGAIEVAPAALGTRRLLHLRGAAGGALPPTARLAILRVE